MLQCGGRTGEGHVVLPASEHHEHRQVGLAVSGVCGPIDRHHLVWCPHHVFAPQIAMLPRRMVVLVEIIRTTPRHDGVGRGAGQSVEARCRELGDRGQPLIGIAIAPVLRWF